MSTPPLLAIQAAIAAGKLSPCAKSKRGVSIFGANVFGNIVVYSQGHNAQPPGFACDGSDECRSACAELCEHAEAAALRRLDEDDTFGPLELLHIKVVDGEAVVSGGPSCSRCSTAILADGRIARVWLLHAEGWRCYGADEFHELSLLANQRPVLRVIG